MSAAAPWRAGGWTLRAFLLFGGGGVVAAVGVATGDPVPLIAALPLLVAPLVVALLLPREIPRVTAEWKVDSAGAQTKVRLWWRPTPPFVPDDLRWQLPSPTPGRWSAGSVEPLEDGSREASFEVRLTQPTVADLPLPTFAWEDPWGLFRRPAIVVGEPGLIDWYPPALIRTGTLQFHRTVSRPGEVRSRSVGPSGEFYGLREAEPLDGPRRINWWATARRGRPVVNEYAVDRTGDVVVLLDLRSTPLGAEADLQIFSVMRAAALALAELFLRERARVAVALYREFLLPTPLAAGRFQRFQIRRLLVAPLPAAPNGPDERCAVSLRRYYPGGVTTVLMTPLASPDPRPLVVHLRRRGFPVIVLSPSPLALPRPSFGLSSVDLDLADRLDRLARQETIATLWNEAPTIDWERFDHLAPLLEFLRRPAIRAQRRSG